MKGRTGRKKGRMGNELDASPGAPCPSWWTGPHGCHSWDTQSWRPCARTGCPRKGERRERKGKEGKGTGSQSWFPGRSWYPGPYGCQSWGALSLCPRTGPGATGPSACTRKRKQGKKRKERNGTNWMPVMAPQDNPGAQSWCPGPSGFQSWCSRTGCPRRGRNGRKGRREGRQGSKGRKEGRRGRNGRRE